MTEATTWQTTAHPAREHLIFRALHHMEGVLDTVMRPGAWAASLSYRLGLQGKLRVVEMVVRPAAQSAPRARPLRIAFAADFHAGPTTDVRTLAAACTALAALEPDVLLLGGDFVSFHAKDIAQLETHLARVRPAFGTFAVLGNHDLRADGAHITSALERLGVRMMTNRRITLPAPFDDVTICGLDDPSRGDPRPDLALDGARGTRIVLMHSPDALESIGDREFDLALCGHTHGGQIALPWGPPLLVPGGPLNRQFCHGRFDLEGPASRTLLVTRGVGCSAVPARVFAAPEIHLCLIA